MTRFDLVVFDLAGTTVHDGDSVAWAMGEAMKTHATLDLSREAINSVMGLATKPLAIAELLRRNGREVIPAVVDQTYAEFEQLMLDYYRSNPQVREIQGTSRLFASLRAAGVKVGLDTAFNRAIGDAIFERLGWRSNRLYDATCTADEVRQGRPAPYMIYRLMEATGVVDVSRVAKVGDTPADLLQGRNAGCGAVFGVAWGANPAEKLAPNPMTRLLREPSELYDALGISPV